MVVKADIIEASKRLLDRRIYLGRIKEYASLGNNSASCSAGTLQAEVSLQSFIKMMIDLLNCNL